MKVVHVITGLGQGGAEAMLEKLVLAARLENPEIVQEVVSLGELGAVGERLVKAGIPVESMAMNGPIEGLAGLARLMFHLRRAGPDTVVQTWMWHGDLVGGLAARLAGNRRVVWNLRNSVPSDPSQRRSSRAVAKACALLSHRVPARIICNARAGVEAHRSIGYDASKCVVIPNGFDLNRFSRSEILRSETRQAWGLREDEHAIGMAARMDPLKDHENFVHAARHAMDRAATPLRFVLVGDGVPENETLLQRIAEAGLSDQFVLEGRREDVPAVMNALDTFCLSSSSEGFPNVLGEAMACETPCLATDVGDVRTILGDDRWVVPPKDPVALGTKMVTLSAFSRDELRIVGQQQRARIQTLFGIDGVWRRYREVYAAL